MGAREEPEARSGDVSKGRRVSEAQSREAEGEQSLRHRAEGEARAR